VRGCRWGEGCSQDLGKVAGPVGIHARNSLTPPVPGSVSMMISGRRCPASPQVCALGRAGFDCPSGTPAPEPRAPSRDRIGAAAEYGTRHGPAIGYLPGSGAPADALEGVPSRDAAWREKPRREHLGGGCAPECANPSGRACHVRLDARQVAGRGGGGRLSGTATGSGPSSRNQSLPVLPRARRLFRTRRDPGGSCRRSRAGASPCTTRSGHRPRRRHRRALPARSPDGRRRPTPHRPGSRRPTLRVAVRPRALLPRSQQRLPRCPQPGRPRPAR
jgi:hypothetical protein